MRREGKHRRTTWLGDLVADVALFAIILTAVLLVAVGLTLLVLVST